jgi:phage baseplate assembly protein W
MSEYTLALPFSLDGFGNIRTTSDQNIIWSNRVRSAIGTIKGERVFRPGYGTRIVDASFDTFTTMEEIINKEVGRVFSELLPLLTFVSVEVYQDIRLNTFTVDVTYELPNRTQETTRAGIMVVSNTNPPYEELV